MKQVFLNFTDDTVYQIKSIFGDMYDLNDIDRICGTVILVALSEELQERADNAAKMLERV